MVLINKKYINSISYNFKWLIKISASPAVVNDLLCVIDYNSLRYDYLDIHYVYAYNIF